MSSTNVFLSNWNGDLESGNFSGWQGWQYKAGAAQSSRILIMTSDGLINAVQGNNMCRLITFSGDTDANNNSGYRTLAICRPPIGTPQSGNFTYQMASGYDSSWHFAINVPANYAGGGTNLFLCGLEMHHTGGAVAPFHMWFWPTFVEFQVAYGTDDQHRQISVSQQILQNYVAGEWYGFALRYKHHPTAGHFEVWAGNMQRDTQLTQRIVAPNIGTMYASDNNYAQWGQYEGNPANTLTMHFDALGEVGTLTEAINYMNPLFAGAPVNPPTITSFSPTSGLVGASIVLTGTNLTGATSVKLNGTTASFTPNSATQITATVPVGATSGTWNVVTPNGSGNSAAIFTVTPPPPPVPTITNFTPTSGVVGATVTIVGTNFTGTTFVRLNGTSSSFTVNSSTQIVTTVPAGATSGNWTVQNASGTGTSTATFTVTPPAAPTISSFSPASGVVGGSVVILGTNFTGATNVRFNGVDSSYTVNSATQITATVPFGATSGLLTVITPSGTINSATQFTVNVAPSVACFATGNTNVQKYGVYEVVLTGTGSYSLPAQYDVICNVTFTPPSGSGNAKTVEAFWDGGTTWRARCYANEIGAWNWTTSSSDGGLGAKSGSFTCTASTSINYIRGKLMPHGTNPRRWKTEDGQTYIGVGDTAYNLFSRTWDNGTTVITEAVFQQYIDDVLQHGVNMIFADINGGGFEDATWANFWSDASHDQPHLVAFQKTDERIRYLLDLAPAIYINMTVLAESPNGYNTDATLWASLSTAKKNRYMRYILARWAAFPEMTWCMTNDTNYDGSHPNNVAMVNEVGNYFAANDKWNNLRSTGGLRNVNYAFTGQAWATYIRIETGNALAADQILTYSATPQLVYLSEDIYEGDGITNPDYFYRWLMWSWIISGGFANYGTNLWDRLTPYESTGYTGMDSLQRIFPFFNSNLIDTALFVTADSLVSDTDGATGSRKVKGMRNGTTQYVVYHPNSSASGAGAAIKSTAARITIDLSAASGVFNVTWYRTSDGLYQTSAQTSGGASRTLTAPWANTDVVLLLTQGSVAPTPPLISTFTPTSGAIGSTVTITGTTFTSDIVASFNGIAAATTFVSSTQITAVVPVAATTGPITVTNSVGSNTSASNYTVTGIPIDPNAPTSGPYGTGALVFDPTGANVSPIGSGWVTSFAIGNESNWQRVSNLLAPTTSTAFISQAYRTDNTYGLDSEIFCKISAKGTVAGDTFALASMISNPNLATRDYYKLEIVIGSPDTWNLWRIFDTVATKIATSTALTTVNGDWISLAILNNGGGNPIVQGYVWKISNPGWQLIFSSLDTTTSQIFTPGYLGIEATRGSAWRIGNIFAGKLNTWYPQGNSSTKLNIITSSGAKWVT